MFNFPAIWHTITIRIMIGGVGIAVNVGILQVGIVGSEACCVIANVDKLHVIVTPEIGFFKEESEVFSPVSQSVTVSISFSWVG